MDQGTHDRAVSFIWQLRTMLMHHLFKRGKTSTQVKMVTSHNNLKNDFRLRLKHVISIGALKSGPCRHCRGQRYRHTPQESKLSAVITGARPVLSGRRREKALERRSVSPAISEQRRN